MLQVVRLMQRPRSFESLCGLNPTEFTLLAEHLEPLCSAPDTSWEMAKGQVQRVFAKLWEVRGEAVGQLDQDIGRRVLFLRVSRTFSSPLVNCRVLRVIICLKL
jgi:uncharacterized protein YlzI (FlbEa/FlbD family)